MVVRGKKYRHRPVHHTGVFFKCFFLQHKPRRIEFRWDFIVHHQLFQLLPLVFLKIQRVAKHNVLRALDFICFFSQMSHLSVLQPGQKIQHLSGHSFFFR